MPRSSAPAGNGRATPVDGAPGGGQPELVVGTLGEALRWVDTTVEEVVDALAGSDLELGEELTGRLRPFVRQVVEAVLRVTRARESLPDGDHQQLAHTCLRYGLEHRLAADVLRLTAEHTWRQLLTTATPAERLRLFDSVERLARLMDLLQRMVVLAYAADVPQGAAVEDPPSAGATVFRPAGARVVVALPSGAVVREATGGGAQETAPPSLKVQAQRLRRRLGHRAGVMELDDVIVLLLPGSGPSSLSGHDLVSHSCEVLATLDLEVPSGMATSPPGSPLSGAVVEACEILSVVQALGYEPRPYQLEDVALEVLLCRSPDIAQRVAQRLEPLRTSGTELLETLTEVLDGSGERRVTARKLCIHPNTLAYRLRKIREMTGLSVTHPPRDQWLLRVALTSLRIIGGLGGPPAVGAPLPAGGAAPGWRL